MRDALALAGLFFAQFVLGAVVPEQLIAAERIGLGVLYLVLGLVIFLRDRKRLPHLLHDGFRAPYAELVAETKGPTQPAG